MPLIVQFSEYGDSEVLRVVDIEPPDPGPGQVRLEVRAAGVNPVDWKIMRGDMRDQFPVRFPAGLGYDVAGVVDRVGAGVTGFKVGDEVLGAARPSFAKFVLADPASLLLKPATLPWTTAGSLAGAGGAAWTGLDRLSIARGELLLIHAVAGGVGSFAAQLAVARGARVLGTDSENNHEYLRSIGVTPVAYGDGLADRLRSLAPQGVDAVLDVSGRGELPLSIELARGPKRVLTLVAFEEAARLGALAHAGGSGPNLRRALQEIVPLIERGRLQVPVSQTYPLEAVAAALDESSSGHVRGKIAILPNQ
jgi:NADPH:quinone reductase-like Zn-dependent oxidoreductase